MATGFPVKGTGGATTYSANSVLSSSDLNDGFGSLNLLFNAQNSAGKNAFINGAADIAQRGTSIAANAGVIYTLDRWAYNCTVLTTCTVSQVASGLTGFRYALRFQRTAGTTTTPAVYLGNSVETSNAILYAGKVVTFSFYIKTGANYSGSGVSWSINYGTGTDENILYGYTGSVTLLSGTFAANTTWTRVTGTATMPSTATEFGTVFVSTTTSTALADDSFYITGVQLELGSSATPFSRAGGSIGGELALCQRYFETLGAGSGPVTSSSHATIYGIYKVTKRAAPSISLQSGTNGIAQIGRSLANITAISTYAGNLNSCLLDATSSDTGMTTNQICVLQGDSVIAISSEL